MLEEYKKFVVGAVENNKRLDVFLSLRITDYSRSYIQKLIKNGLVKINNRLEKTPKTSVFDGDVIDIDWPEEKHSAELKAEEFDFDILYEDEDVLVIDKPAGVVVHPAAGNWEGTVVNALVGRYQNFAKSLSDEADDILAAQRPGIVHRLDKDTSGCLIVAKNVLSKNKLSAAFANRKIVKTYFAVTYGCPKKNRDTIKTLIGRHSVNRQKMAVVLKNGKEAITDYVVEKKGAVNGHKVCLLKVNIHTGRTHQIRVHLAHLKSPVLGDDIYGGHQKVKAHRQMLHAGIISFPHPKTGETITVTSSFPEDFQQILNQL
jgi:23S rRNA pseudouridine1911/1915/1917 synthase